MARHTAQSMARASTRARTPARTRTLRPDELAWVIVLPCALVVIAVIALVGPPLGDAAFGSLNVRFWPTQPDIHPEPHERSGYLLASLAPLLPSALVLLGPRRELSLEPATIRRLVLMGQFAALGALLATIVGQHLLKFGVLFTGRPEVELRRAYFTWPSVAVAVGFALLVAAALHRREVTARIADWARDTRARVVTWQSAAVLFTATWLLIAIHTDASVGNTHTATSGFIKWSMEETFAVIDGRSPLVDFHAQYSTLWPYAAAGVMAVLGTSLTVWTLFMATISALALLSIYAVLRRIVGSALLALLLYVPFVANGFFMYLGPLDNRYAPANLYSQWPERHGGPYFLAFLTARHLSGAWPRRLWPIGLAGGIVVLNNPEFGISGLLACAAALLWAGRVNGWAQARRIGLEALAGLLGAVALVTGFLLMRTGELPHYGMLSEFSRLYGLGGWAMTPMPRFGFHIAVYLTFVAAIVVATVRAVRREPDVLLTAMLAWSGVFGLGAGNYYAGNSHPENLISIFSSWTFALALLVVVAVRSILARGERRPTLADLAVLLAFGLAVCSIAQTPTPWTQLQRLRTAAPVEILRHNDAERFVARHTRPGERVVIMFPISHRIAYDLGLVNVSPYALVESTPTYEQFHATVDALRAAHGTKYFLWANMPQQPLELERRGFKLQEVDATTGYMLYRDTRAER